MAIWCVCVNMHKLVFVGCYIMQLAKLCVHNQLIQAGKRRMHLFRQWQSLF